MGRNKKKKNKNPRRKYKVFVVGNERYDLPVGIYGELEFDVKEFLKCPRQYRMVVLTGGEDIHPGLYGQAEAKQCGYINERRDMRDIYITQIAIANNIPIVGICRGAQILNVMSGGYLVQHCDNHGCWHDMTTVDGETMVVSSTHHQMMMPPASAKLLAWSTKRQSTEYICDCGKIKKPEKETEVVYLPDIKSLAFQYHPEYMHEDDACVGWFNETIKKYLRISRAPENFQDHYISLPKEPITKEGLEKERKLIATMTKQEQIDYSWDQYEENTFKSIKRDLMSKLWTEDEAEQQAQEEFDEWQQSWKEAMAEQNKQTEVEIAASESTNKDTIEHDSGQGSEGNQEVKSSENIPKEMVNNAEVEFLT